MPTRAWHKQLRMVSPNLQQAQALLGLRARLWWRRMVQERRWGRAALLLIGALIAAAVSSSICLLIYDRAGELRRDPAALAAQGGPMALFATWLTMVLVGRLWFALMPAAQSQAFLDPRRLRLYPVPARLLSALNLVALFLDPIWLVLYPPLIFIAISLSHFFAAPSLWPLLFAEALSVWATIGLLHLGSAVAALFDSRPVLRRGFTVALLLAGFAAFQLSVALPRRPGVASLFARHHWRAIAWTPPGWAALLAQELIDLRPLHALTPALLLFLLGLLCSVAAHRLSLREVMRPPETVQARWSHARGWRLPLVPDGFSAMFEKEAKMAVRIGWLQLVLVPVAYLLLVRTVFTGPEPLLIAAVYAHLGVLEIATNAFGRDVAAARAYFLWPVSLRGLLAAKNAVAYCFSLAIFALLAGVAWTSARVTSEQLLIGLLAHAAIFPLLATFGNIVSTYFPVPVRGARLRRVRGAGPIGARLLALTLLAAAAWAPYAIARATGLRLWAAYAGELLALGLAYGALLSFAAHLVDARREPLLSALAKDE